VAFANVLTRTAKGYALVDKAIVTYFGGFANNNAYAVVNNKSAAYCSTGMDFYTRFSYSTLGYCTCNKFHFVLIKPMGSSVHTQSLNAGIEKENFNPISCGGVAIHNRLYIFSDSFEHYFTSRI
jgi:hypothetical protein